MPRCLLASLLFVVIESVGPRPRQQAFAARSAHPTASHDCAATFTIASEKINGLPINPPPKGTLQVWINNRYRYADTTADTNEPGDNWRYIYQTGTYTFQDGPLAHWNPGQSGSEGRSIWFKFKSRYGAPVEIVMQESDGCSPWPSCSKCR